MAKLRHYGDNNVATLCPFGGKTMTTLRNNGGKVVTNMYQTGDKRSTNWDKQVATTCHKVGQTWGEMATQW